MGAVLSAELGRQLTAVLGGLEGPARTQLEALIAHPDALIEPTLRSALPPAVLAAFSQGLANALHGVFLVGLGDRLAGPALGVPGPGGAGPGPGARRQARRAPIVLIPGHAGRASWAILLAPRGLKVDREIRIPAGTGAGLRVAAGEYVQIVDVEGRGCADFFALAASDPARVSLGVAHAGPDRPAVSAGRPVVLLEPAGARCCSSRRTARRACTTCSSPRAIRPATPSTTSPATPRAPRTFSAALRSLGASCPHVPQPVNFFMNVAVRPDGSVTFGPPQTEAGDWVLLRAFMDCLVVLSACPQQWNPATNYHPSDLLARILTR